MSQKFRFKVFTNLMFGTGESEQLGAEIKKMGFFKIAAIVDQGVFDHPQTKKTLASIEQAAISMAVHKNSAVEPDYDYLDNYRVQFMGKDYDCVLAIGGGSTLDLGKAIATLIVNPGSAINYRGFPVLKSKPLPVIAVPTTAGTGSEITYNAVFTDSKLKKKLGINSEHNYPALAVIDPLFTVNSPKSVTVSSGADALVHTLESFVHKNHTPVSRMFSLEAFRLLFNNLSRVLDEPGDLDIRRDIALGAYLAGAALINAGSGPSGAFSYPLGAVYKVSHGYAGAVFISSITRINIEKGYEDYALLYDLIEGADRSIPVKLKNLKFAEKIQSLMDKLDIPRSLSAYKLGPEDIKFMIGQYDVLKAAIAQNSLEITKEDAEKMMLALA